MFFYLLLAFTFVPAVEIALFVRIGSIIGPFATFAVVLGTGIAGASLARSQGVRVLTEIRQSLEAGRLPTDELAGGVLVLIGGTLLLTPGFLTDIIGLACLAPVSRHILAGVIKRWFKQRLAEIQASGGKGAWQVKMGGVRPGPASRAAQSAAYGGGQVRTNGEQQAHIRQTGPRTIDASYSVIESVDVPDGEESADPSDGEESADPSDGEESAGT